MEPVDQVGQAHLEAQLHDLAPLEVRLELRVEPVVDPVHARRGAGVADHRRLGIVVEALGEDVVAEVGELISRESGAPTEHRVGGESIVAAVLVRGRKPAQLPLAGGEAVGAVGHLGDDAERLQKFGVVGDRRLDVQLGPPRHRAPLLPLPGLEQQGGGGRVCVGVFGVDEGEPGHCLQTHLGSGELGDAGDGLVRLGHVPGRAVPHVDHVGPDLEGHVDAGSGGLGGEPGRVVQQNLGVADLDQERGQVGQVAVEGRGKRVLGVTAAEEQVGDLEDLYARDHRVCRGPGLHRVAGGLHVQPR